MTPIDVVIDTDIGADPDDAIALALAVASPELNILGVTIVSGDVEWRSRMAARALGMLGRSDIPVFRGEGSPLSPPRGSAMLGFEGRGLLDVPYEGPEATIAELDAVSWLIAESLQRSFHIIAIGPLTNIASAIRQDPEFDRRNAGFSVMGGIYNPGLLPESLQHDIRTPGTSSWPDYNTWSDPDAALICAESHANITWITTETTLEVPLHHSWLDRLPAHQPFSKALRTMVASWDHYRDVSGTQLAPTNEDTLSRTETFLHDPLTIGSLFAGDWLTLRRVNLRYTVNDHIFRIADAEDLAESPMVSQASVSVNVDGQAFEALCIQRIADHLQELSGQSSPDPDRST